MTTTLVIGVSPAKHSVALATASAAAEREEAELRLTFEEVCSLLAVDPIVHFDAWLKYRFHSHLPTLAPLLLS